MFIGLYRLAENGWRMMKLTCEDVCIFYTSTRPYNDRRKYRGLRARDPVLLPLCRVYFLLCLYATCTAQKVPFSKSPISKSQVTDDCVLFSDRGCPALLFWGPRGLQILKIDVKVESVRISTVRMVPRVQLKKSHFQKVPFQKVKSQTTVYFSRTSGVPLFYFGGRGGCRFSK